MQPLQPSARRVIGPRDCMAWHRTGRNSDLCLCNLSRQTWNLWAPAGAVILPPVIPIAAITPQPTRLQYAAPTRRKTCRRLSPFIRTIRIIPKKKNPEAPSRFF